MSILIQHATLVLPDGPRQADLRVENGKIAELGPNLPLNGATPLDASGKLVFPGFIDTHTHFEMNKGLPNETADDWASGTRSALFGGTTTVLDFAEPDRGASLQSALDTWHRRADGRAACNYSFHMTIKDWNDGIRAELPAMTAQGITSYKIYLAYAMRVSDTVAYEAIRAIGQEGAVVGCHCENGELVDAGIAAQKALGRLGPDAHPDARPPAVEAEAVTRYLTIAELAGVPVNIVHLSTLRGLEAVRAARSRGQKLYVETCPQYLMLDDSVYHLPGFESAKYVFAPPARAPENREALWQAVADGAVDTIGTDHCSFSTATKALGKDDFSKIPNGMPGVEDRGRLLYTYGVAAGKITLSRMAELLSANPAKLFGMYPKKGCLAVGSDADLVIYDPNPTGTIRAAANHSACDYDPYEGVPVTGQVDAVVLNGKLAVHQGQLLVEQGGQFVRRGPAQFWR